MAKLCRILCILMIVSIILCSSACSNQTKSTLSWSMYAMLVTPDGQVTDRFPITVSGEIFVDKNDLVRLLVDILTPDQFRYIFTKPDQGADVSISHEIKASYYIWRSHSFDRTSASYVDGSYGLCTEKQYLIMSWDDDESLYLVASLDENTDPSTILSYFRGFIDTHSYEN